MQSSEYVRLDSTSEHWKCFRCNFTISDGSLYHSYNIEVSNSFSLLAGDMFNNSVFEDINSPRFQPRSHSSPLNSSIPASSNSRLNSSNRHIPNIQPNMSYRPLSSSSKSNSSHALPKKAKNLRFLAVNCNGIRSKKAELENLTTYVQPDILLLCETKLDNNVQSAEFMPPGYIGFRKDRASGAGGVMVMIKDHFTACEVPLDDVTGEVCWVKVETQDNPLYVGSFYRTPSDRSTHQVLELEKSLNVIQNKTKNNPNATVVVAGDFNVGDICWDEGTAPPGAKDRTVCLKVLEVLNTFNLNQQQRLATRENRVLDLFCTNKPGLTKSIHVLPGI